MVGCQYSRINYGGTLSHGFFYRNYRVNTYHPILFSNLCPVHTAPTPLTRQFWSIALRFNVPLDAKFGDIPAFVTINVLFILVSR